MVTFQTVYLSQCSLVATNLDSMCHGVDSVLCDVIQAQLEGCDHHAGLKLPPRGQQQGVSAEPQLFLLTPNFPLAERLGSTQRVLGLEAVLRGTVGSDDETTCSLIREQIVRVTAHIKLLPSGTFPLSFGFARL